MSVTIPVEKSTFARDNLKLKMASIGRALDAQQRMTSATEKLAFAFNSVKENPNDFASVHVEVDEAAAAMLLCAEQIRAAILEFHDDGE